MTTLEEIQFFYEQFAADSVGVSALLPTSAFSAREMGSEVARRKGGRRVLEVGTGTGSIAVEIAKMLGPDDELWLCEYNPEFTDFLTKRVATDDGFAAVRKNVHIFTGSILELPEEATQEKFDFIVSSLPHNSFELGFVQQIFEVYQSVLAQNGVLSYIEYIGGRELKKWFKPDDPAEDSHPFTAEMLETYGVRTAKVMRNAPPAFVHHLRFGESQPADADKITDFARDKFEVGGMAFDQDALLFVGPLLAWAIARKRWWPALLAIPIALFFRDPERRTKRKDGDILAAGDGEVLEIATVKEDGLGDSEWLRIAVFLSIADVHVNRSPVSGRVRQAWHKQGLFEVANTPEAVHNESVYTLIDTKNGPIAVAQRVGAVARRVVNRTKPNALLVQGEKLGLMRFGSRIDVYIPAGKAESLVQVGGKVVGGETILAKYL